MTTNKLPIGRSANQQQRQFAAEILASYKKTGNLGYLIDALEHFSQTGDFSPFSKVNQRLKKRIIFSRLFAYVQRSKGQSHEDLLDQLAGDLHISDSTVKRMLSGQIQTNARLTGEDALFDFLLYKLISTDKTQS